VTGNVEGLRNPRNQSSGIARETFLVMPVGHHDREFVSAKARDIICAARLLAQSIRDFP